MGRRWQEGREEGREGGGEADEGREGESRKGEGREEGDVRLFPINRRAQATT